MRLLLNRCFLFLARVSYAQKTEKENRMYSDDLFQNKPTDVQAKATVLYVNNFSIPST
jgi:hypothetical protein